MKWRVFFYFKYESKKKAQRQQKLHYVRTVAELLFLVVRGIFFYFFLKFFPPLGILEFHGALKMHLRQDEFFFGFWINLKKDIP